MENTNNSFEKMMRDAMASIGTSHSFTRRLMLRIEREKEMRRVARLSRIYNTVAAVVAVILLSGAGFVLWDTFASGGGVGVSIVDGIVVKLKTLWEQTRISSLLINGLTVSMAILAVVAFDSMLKREYSQR